MKKLLLSLLALVSPAPTSGSFEMLRIAVPSQNSEGVLNKQVIPFPKWTPSYDAQGNQLTKLSKVVVMMPCVSYGRFTMGNNTAATYNRVLRYAFEGYELWTQPEVDRFNALFPFPQGFNPGNTIGDFFSPKMLAGSFSHGRHNGYADFDSGLLGLNSNNVVQPGAVVINERINYSYYIYEFTDVITLSSLTRRFGEDPNSTTEWTLVHAHRYNTFVTPPPSPFGPILPFDVNVSAGSYYVPDANSTIPADTFAESIIVKAYWENA